MTVEVVEPLGSEVMVHGSVATATDRAPVTARLESGARPVVGAILRLAFDPGHVHVFDGVSLEAVTPA